jgi:hypothetical protein
MAGEGRPSGAACPWRRICSMNFISARTAAAERRGARRRARGRQCQVLQPCLARSPSRRPRCRRRFHRGAASCAQTGRHLCVNKGSMHSGTPCAAHTRATAARFCTRTHHHALRQAAASALQPSAKPLRPHCSVRQTARRLVHSIFARPPSRYSHVTPASAALYRPASRMPPRARRCARGPGCQACPSCACCSCPPYSCLPLHCSSIATTRWLCMLILAPTTCGAATLRCHCWWAHHTTS